MFNPVVKNLVLNATKTFGLDPEKIISFVTESLTQTEIKDLRVFLEWCLNHCRIYDYNDFESVYNEYEASLK